MVTRRLCAFPFPKPANHAIRLRYVMVDYCLMHSPEHAKEVQEARRIGGFTSQTRSDCFSVAFDFEGLDTVDAISSSSTG